MPDTFSPEKRSLVMSRIRSKGNVATEMRFISILRYHKITGWRRNVKLPGKPDFVFRRERVAVFIDGDFWHGNPKKFRIPKSNVEYWEKKILSNKRRDRRVNRLLRTLGWRVIRFWQSNLNNEKVVVGRLRRALNVSRQPDKLKNSLDEAQPGD